MESGSMSRFAAHFGRWSLRLAFLCLLAPLPAALVGCGGGEQRETGTRVTTPPEQIQADNNMIEFMKKGGGQAEPKK